MLAREYDHLLDVYTMAALSNVQAACGHFSLQLHLTLSTDVPSLRDCLAEASGDSRERSAW